MTTAPAPSAPPVRPIVEPAKPLRGEVPPATGLFWGVTCVACVLTLWFVGTADGMRPGVGPEAATGPETRLISPSTLPSPAETLQVIDSKEPAGRRLDFLMQEFNREANTLSSKSQDSETTRAAVDMKVLIEQMREQVQNVE